MEIDSSPTDVTQFFKIRSVGRKILQMEFVDKIFPSLKDLAGTSKGIVVHLEEGDLPWPSLEDYRAMDDQGKRMIQARARNKFVFALPEIRRRIDYKFYPRISYIGNGKVIFWWQISYKKIKNITKLNGD